MLRLTSLRPLPVDHAIDTFVPRHLRRPVEQTFCLPVVRNEKFLVALAPGKTTVFQRGYKLSLKHLKELKQRHAVVDSAADVESLAACLLDMVKSRHIAADRVGNVKKISDLLAVPGDGERLALGVSH